MGVQKSECDKAAPLCDWDERRDVECAEACQHQITLDNCLEHNKGTCRWVNGRCRDETSTPAPVSPSPTLPPVPTSPPSPRPTGQSNCAEQTVGTECRKLE